MHAGYIFEKDDVRIVFDPIFENPFSVNCHAFPAVEFDPEAIRREKFAAVFISHYHDDHCSFASLDLIDRETPLYLFCIFEEMFALLRELGFRNVHALTLGQSVTIGDLAITPRRALDADVDSIFTIQTGELNILHVVDAWIDDEMLDELSLTKWDLVLWPFQTMREIEVLTPSRLPVAETQLPPEWMAQLRRLNPLRIVPSSCQFRFEEWSWLNVHYFPISYDGFVKQVSAALPACSIHKMNPGETYLLHKNSFELCGRVSWVAPRGDQNSDYYYDPQMPVQSLYEIAALLQPLSEMQRMRIESFLSVKGLQRWLQSSREALDDFFKLCCRWKLSVYYSAHERRDYEISLADGSIINVAEVLSEPQSSPADLPDWHTEIIAIKLWGALEEGESLSSLYVRINDGSLNKETDSARADVDILRDPLLLCLYSGKFASYQRAQLRRLRL